MTGSCRPDEPRHITEFAHAAPAKSGAHRIPEPSVRERKTHSLRPLPGDLAKKSLINRSGVFSEAMSVATGQSASRPTQSALQTNAIHVAPDAGGPGSDLPGLNLEPAGTRSDTSPLLAGMKGLAFSYWN